MSQQGVLPDLFVVPVADLPAVPQQCQREGREQARDHKDRIWFRMKACYLMKPWTDADLADRLGIERSTVNARRNEHAEVVPMGKRKNRHSGVNNTLWGFR